MPKNRGGELTVETFLLEPPVHFNIVTLAERKVLAESTTIRTPAGFDL
jgi:hypothetical protein